MTNTARTRIEFLKFMASGIIVIGVDALVYFVCLNFLTIPVSKAISFTIGGCLAFILTKYWTFEQNSPPLQDASKYILTNSVAIFINVEVNSLAIKLIGGQLFAALVIAKGVTSMFTFWIYKHWVFPRTSVLSPTR